MADEIGIHDDGVLTAVRGTIFMAKAETIITSALLKQFTVEAATVGVGDGMWTNLGHMSNDNLPEFALDGGDATTLSTWLKAAFRTQYAQTTGTVTFNSVQGDKGTFKTFYNAVDMTGAGVACISSSRCFVFSHVFFSGLGSCMHFPYFSGCAEVFLPNMRASLTRRLWPVNSRSRPWCTMRSMIAAASLSSAKTVPHLLNSMFVVNMMLRLS